MGIDLISLETRVTFGLAAKVKNNTAFRWAALLVNRGVFHTVEYTQDRVGHTHGRVDQRFSTVTQVLHRHGCLEDPDAFANVIQGTLKTQRNRKVIVKQVGDLADWKGFLEKVPGTLHGHTQTQSKSVKNEEACHTYRFCKRCSLLLPDGDIDESGFPDDLRSPDDIFILSKQHMSSECLSQPPLLFAPASLLSMVPEGGPIALAPRAPLSAATAAAYRTKLVSQAWRQPTLNSEEVWTTEKMKIVNAPA